MEKQSTVSKSVKAKRKTPASKARREMIKQSAMKLASLQRKIKAPDQKKTVALVKKKKAKNRIGIPLKSDRVAFVPTTLIQVTH
jgi:hypothetical protein